MTIFFLLLAARRYEIRKGIRILPVIEPPGKLVHVKREIFLAYLVVAPHDPAFQQAPKAIEVLGMDVPTHIFALVMAYSLVGKSLPFEKSIAHTFVRSYQGNIVLNRLMDKLLHDEWAGAVDDFSYNHSLTSNSANNGDFALCPAPYIEPLRLMFEMLFPAYVSFIDFHFSGKFQSITLHGRSPAVTHIPTGMVVGAGILTEDNPVDLQGADALLAHEHQVSDLEPKFQGYLCILKNGVSDNGEAITIPTAAIVVLAEPVKRSRLESIDFFTVAARTANAARPAHISEKLPARLLGRELPVKGIYCFHGCEFNTEKGRCQYPPNRRRS